MDESSVVHVDIHGQRYPIRSGLDAAYVAEDAAFDAAVENLVDGSFFNSGQSCCGIERIYVHRSIYERFVEAFVAKTEEYIEVGRIRGRIVTLYHYSRRLSALRSLKVFIEASRGRRSRSNAGCRAKS